MKKILVSLIFIILFANCSKEKSIISEKNQLLNRQEQISIISNDKVFMEFLKIDKEIISKSNEAGSNNIEMLNILLQKKFNDLNTKIKLEKGLQEAGFENSKTLIELFEKKLKLGIYLVGKYNFLSKLKQDDLKLFLKEAIAATNEIVSSEFTLAADECSGMYAVGMQGCGDAFAITAAGVSIAASLAALGGTPIMGSITFYTGMGLAYLQLESCKATVVAEWRICREAHPIN